MIYTNSQFLNLLSSSSLHLYMALGSPSDENLNFVLFLFWLTSPLTSVTEQSSSAAKLIDNYIGALIALKRHMHTYYAYIDLNSNGLEGMSYLGILQEHCKFLVHCCYQNSHFHPLMARDYHMNVVWFCDHHHMLLNMMTSLSMSPTHHLLQ